MQLFLSILFSKKDETCEEWEVRDGIKCRFGGTGYRNVVNNIIDALTLERRDSDLKFVVEIDSKGRRLIYINIYIL